jgi:aspartyl-tRNA(Asn)/glutamyl-tRNA(Gln) amidotransferase subunit A
MGSSNENSVYGPVKNALDPSKVPGGSSGGSAVAIQADMCMISLGSDTGGSVRQPADFCGIIGMKPGYGSVSRNGLIAYASSFDQIGIFAKHIDDVKCVYEIMSRPDSLDSTMRKKNSDDLITVEENAYRIAVLDQTLNHPSIDSEISLQLQQAIQSWTEHGFQINPVEFDMIDYVVPAYYVMTAAEASSNLSRYDGIRYGHQSHKSADSIQDFYINNRTEGFGPEVKRRILLGNFVLSSGYYDAHYQKAQQVRKLLVEKTAEIFKHHDAILMPVSPTTAFTLGEKQKDPVAMYLADIFTVLANLVGATSIALPSFKHSNGMPFGFQLLMPAGKEINMLKLSDQLLKSVK